MYFLIDYENVQKDGMAGTDFLRSDDHVILFYSDAVGKIALRYLKDIENSGCAFSAIKLIKPLKNALDFYIAGKAGEIFGAGYTGSIVIVSKDAGFQAVRDFWEHYGNTKQNIVLSVSIEHGIVSATENDARKAAIQSLMLKKSIDEFNAAYTEKQNFRKKLHEIFAGTDFSDRVDELESLLKQDQPAKVIYLDTLRQFGRKDGLEIYRTLKKHFAF